MSWSSRFLVRGILWRQLLRWAVLSVPLWLEPIVIAFWSLIFLLWGPGRRGVMQNLSAIIPGSSVVANFARTYRVFWNFAWTITDTVRFKEKRIGPDWEFTGFEYFKQLESQPGGAIILTAHMGNYDLGAQLFAEISHRRIVMVRAPEADPETRRYEEELNQRTRSEGLRIDFSSRAGELALDLLDSLRQGEIIAIQGDRVTPGISPLPATLFGIPAEVPAGPFALSMAAGVPIYPLFIVRSGRRRYRLVVCRPFQVTRMRDRSEAFELSVSQWVGYLENIIRGGWYQWFTFEPFSRRRPT